jgi:CDP-diacylglycerol--serine O-phosphatidyltransferase
MGRKRRRKSSAKRRRDMRKSIYVLPNLLTTMGLFCGFLAMILSMQKEFRYAAIAILVALIFDFLDGKVARATGATSRFGVEYDSLSDLVAFGVSPAILAYLWGLQSFGRLGWIAAFLYVACGALRLARFNVQTEKVGSKHFVGLPIPAAASMVCSVVLLFDELGYPGPVTHWSLVALVIVLAFLMVSPLPYLSFKEIGITRLKSFNWLVAGLLLITLIAIRPQIMGFVCFGFYVLVLGPVGAQVMARRRKAAEALQAAEENQGASSA